MKPTIRRCCGFSLIELLVVLVIVGILTGVGVTMLGDRRGSAVRSILDEVEGAIANAQKGSITSNRDVYITTSGIWGDGSLILDGRPLRPPPITSNPPVAADLLPGIPAETIGPARKRDGGDSECFRSNALRDRDHMSAGVDVGNALYGIALGGSPALDTVAPISGQADFVAALANPLFLGPQNSVVINGQTRRFMQGFCVVVVGLAAGNPLANGPVGILVVPQNSATVYKYYKADQSAVWRKI